MWAAQGRYDQTNDAIISNRNIERFFEKQSNLKISNSRIADLRLIHNLQPFKPYYKPLVKQLQLDFNKITQQT